MSLEDTDSWKFTFVIVEMGNRLSDIKVLVPIEAADEVYEKNIRVYYSWRI